METPRKFHGNSEVDGFPRASTHVRGAAVEVNGPRTSAAQQKNRRGLACEAAYWSQLLFKESLGPVPLFTSIFFVASIGQTIPKSSETCRATPYVQPIRAFTQA